MTELSQKRWTALAVMVILTVAVPTVSGQARKQPPEMKAYLTAVRIEDPAARIKELQKLISEYPESRLRASMEMAVTNARIEMCTTVEAVLQLQKPVLDQLEGLSKLSSLSRNASQILDHKNLSRFDKDKTVKAVLSYINEGRTLTKDPGFIDKIPANQKRYLSNVMPGLILTEGRAYAYGGETDKVFAALEAYDEVGGQKTGGYHYLKAEALAAAGNQAEAFQAYLNAAVFNFRDSIAKAETLHVQAGGTRDGFQDVLNEKLRELPFRSERFKPSAEWNGKAVLLELFTGSECPPCVAADLGFDGIIEAFDPKYAAVLVYHLPIPGPDPMMNPATRKRQTFYEVNSTPTVAIDGEKRKEYIGGGSRAMAGAKFEFYAKEIMARVYEKPVLVIEAAAVLKGDVVIVEYSADMIPSGAEVHVALVQKEEKHRGSNGLLFHKMTVRDFQTSAAEAGQLRFDLAESEQATATYLTEFEKGYARIPNFKFRNRRHIIDRDGLIVVVFVQDRATKKVFNSVVTGVSR